MSKTLDFLVTCVDNYGDIGFALDLAESILFAQPDWNVRFFSDNSETFDRLADARPHPGVSYGELSQYETIEPSEFIVSFFDRKLPEAHFARYAKAKKILSLSCLRFDTDIPGRSGVGSMNGVRYKIGADEVVHLVPSPLAEGAGVVMTDCMGSHGILTSLQKPKNERRFLEGVKSHENPCVSVFCYPETTIKIEKIQNVLRTGEFIGFWIGNALGKSLPFLRFDEYAATLCEFDANIVRGENSAVKAMLAGKPFLWDFYKEKNGAHVEKIEDFLAFMEPFFEKIEDFRNYGKAIRTFNAPNLTESDFTEVDARTCAEILTHPTQKMCEAFGRMAEAVRGRDLVKTVLSEFTDARTTHGENA